MKYTSLEFDEFLDKERDSHLKDIIKHQRLVGKLTYLIITRSNICFAVRLLNQFMHAPKEFHFDAAFQVIRYIERSPGEGLLIKSNNRLMLQAYCDATYGFCPIGRHSTIGFCIMLRDSLISWKSKK